MPTIADTEIYDSLARDLEYEHDELGASIVPEKVINSWRLIDTTSLKREAALKQALRLNSFANLYYFTIIALRKNRVQRNPDLRQNLHFQMCQAVMKDGLKEVIEIPRDHYKSTIYSEAFPIWRALPFESKDEDVTHTLLTSLGYSESHVKLYIEWMHRCHQRDIRILLCSETISNARKLGVRIRNHYDNGELFRDLFPEILPDASCQWTNESLQQKRTKAGTQFGEGTFDFIGVGAALQSRHYDIVVQDDLVGRDARKSEIVMNDTIEYHQLLVGAFDANTENEGRDNDEIVVGNRWSYNDLNSYIRTNERYYNFITHSALGGCCQLHQIGTPIFPEAFNIKKLERYKKRLGTYHFSCFPEDAPVLMADFTEKKISDLQLGDKIVGYNTENYQNLQQAEVQFINKRKAEVYEYKIYTNGKIRTIRCTEDHKFLNAVHRDRELYSKLRVGYEIISSYVPSPTPTIEEQRDLDWLGGILDGEGSCTTTAIFICQSPTANPVVWKAIDDTLKRLKIDYTFQSTSDQFVLRGGRSLIIRLLSYARMYKKQRFVDRIWIRAGRVGENHSKSVILSKILIGEMDVYNIQSSSGNYVAYGYATKNCQYLNFPINPEKCKFNKANLRYFHYERTYDAITYNENRIETQGTYKGKSYRIAIRHHVHAGDHEDDIYPRNLKRYMVVDPNHSGKDGRCRHAITITGVSQNPRRVYLLCTWAEATDINTFVAMIFRLAVAFRIDKIHIETVAAQKYLKFHLEYYVQSKRKEVPEIANIRFADLKSSTTANAKYERIDSVIPVTERGELWIDANDCTKFLEEYEAYGNKKGLVDILDTLGYGPQVWDFDDVDEEELEKIILAQQHRFRRAMRVSA